MWPTRGLRALSTRNKSGAGKGKGGKRSPKQKPAKTKAAKADPTGAEAASPSNASSNKASSNKASSKKGAPASGSSQGASSGHVPDRGDAPTAAAARWVGLILLGLAALRVMVTGHAPSATDAWLGGGFAVVLGLRAMAGQNPPGRDLALGGAMAALFVAAASFSPHKQLALLHAATPIAAILAYLAARELDDDDAELGLWGLTLGAGLASAVSIWQRLVIYPDALARQGELNLEASVAAKLAELRPLGLSLSPDLMGALALTGVVCGLILAARAETKAGRAPAGGLAALCLFALLASRSAGCLVASTVVVAVTVWVLRPKLTGLMVVLTGLVFAGVLSFRGLGSLMGSVSARAQNWWVGLQVFGDNLFGVGLGGFARGYLEARPPEANVTRYAHSTAVHWVAELGVIGVVMLVLVTLAVVASLGRLKSIQAALKEGREVPMKGALPKGPTLLVGLALALFIRGLIDYDFQVGQTAAVFGIVLGLSRGEREKADGPAVLSVRASFAFAATAGLMLWVASQTAERERALDAFGPAAAAPTEQGLAELFAFAETHPGDPQAQSLAIQLRWSQLRDCRGDCAAETKAFAHRMKVAMQDAYRSAPTDLVAGLADAKKGELGTAMAHFEDALRKDKSMLSAHRARLQLAVEHAMPSLPAYKTFARRWLPENQATPLLEDIALLEKQLNILGGLGEVRPGAAPAEETPAPR